MKGEEKARIRGAWAEEPDIDDWDWSRETLTHLPADTQVG